MNLSRRAVLAAGAAAPILFNAEARAQTLPSASARGWVQGTLGGAGGAIVQVTTLAREGQGSLDAALRMEGRRIIVFEVGGVINLQGESLAIRNPFVTIAGETAPGAGITLTGGGLRILTQHVHVRHLMVRPGDLGRPPESGWEVDSLVCEREAADVLVEHCSLSWGTDENLSVTGPRFAGETPDDWRQGTAKRITYAHNIIAEGLSHATHSKGEHSKGSLIHDNIQGVLLYRNLYLSNRERNPLFKGGTQGAVVNNLIYNPGRRFLHYNLHAREWEGKAYQLGRLAVVGNEFRAGPSTPEESFAIALGGEGPLSLYAADNLCSAIDGAAPPAPFGRFGSGEATLIEEDTPSAWPEGLEVCDAAEAAASVLTSAGARPWARHAIDARLIAELLEGRGQVIDSQSQVGGYPADDTVYRPFEPAAWDLVSGRPQRQSPI
ncbi:MAG: pectate lyase family protein [Caulobacterales bacterium]